MIGHLRIKSPWSQLALFLGLFGCSFIFTNVLTLLILHANDINVLQPKSMDLNDPQVVGLLKFLQALSSVVWFVVPALVFALLTFTGRYGYFLGFKKAEKANMYVLAVIGILLALPFVFWLGQLNQQIPLPDTLTKLEEDAAETMEAFLKVNGPFDVFINVVIIALLPAIAEEMCFRGALQRIVIHLTRNPWAGIVITAILFSALHFQFQGFLPRMFLGIVLGAFYWFSGSLWPSIAAHFANNALQVIAVSYMPDLASKNPEMPVLAAIVSGVAVWAILWFYSRQSTVTYDKVYRTDDLTPFNQFLS